MKKNRKIRILDLCFCVQRSYSVLVFAICIVTFKQNMIWYDDVRIWRREFCRTCEEWDWDRPVGVDNLLRTWQIQPHIVTYNISRSTISSKPASRSPRHLTAAAVVVGHKVHPIDRHLVKTTAVQRLHYLVNRISALSGSFIWHEIVHRPIQARHGLHRQGDVLYRGRLTTTRTPLSGVEYYRY